MAMPKSQRRTRRKSEGCVYRRKDGRWEAKLDLGRIGGKRKRVSFIAHSEAEVVEKLAEAQHKRRRNLPVSFERQTVSQYLAKWLDGIRPPMTRPRTFERFAGIVRNHLDPAIGAIRLDRLTPQQVQTLRNSLLKLADGLSPQTVRHLRTVLGIALNQAVKFDAVARNVARLTDPPPLERKPVTPLTPEEAKRLLAAAQGDRLEAVYSVALAIGLRRGEALGLAWSDLDLDGARLRVNASLQRTQGRLQLLAPKTQTSRRTVSLPEFAIKALRRHRARQAEERLAGAKWTDSGLVFTTKNGSIRARNLVRISRRCSSARA